MIIDDMVGTINLFNADRTAYLTIENTSSIYDSCLINGILYDDNFYSFDSGDLYNIINNAGITDKIINITDLVVHHKLRRNGIGSELLKDICNKYSDYIILITPYVSKLEYDVNTIEDCQSILNDISSFMEYNNFDNVNLYLSKYESKDSYIYKNIVGIKAIECLKNEYREYEKSKMQ